MASSRTAQGTGLQGPQGATGASGGSGATGATGPAISVATQAEMEAASDITKAVTPGRTHFHPGVAKFWAKIAGNGTAITSSYNCTSVADTGAGQVTLTIATDFSDANWCCSATVEFSSTTIVKGVHITSPAAGTVLIVSVTEAASAADPTNYHVIGFGDHA